MTGGGKREREKEVGSSEGYKYHYKSILTQPHHDLVTDSDSPLLRLQSA